MRAMDRLSRGFVTLAACIVMSSVLGCGSVPEMVFQNQTSSTIAVAPSLILDPCSSISMTDNQARAFGAARLKLSLDDDRSWVPSGAVVFDPGVSLPAGGGTRPFTVVITGPGSFQGFSGTVPADAFPTCPATRASG
jgi:hypothetical protein